MNAFSAERATRPTQRHVVRVVSTLLAAAVTSALAACSSSAASHHGSAHGSASSTNAMTAQVAIGDLRISGGYIPQQASPDVASAYFTVENTGRQADTLSRVTTNVTSEVMAMTETDQGATGSMTDLPKVVIPAHGTYRFTQGHAHLMLEKPSHMLKRGEKVAMTITFARGGTVRLVLPVVGFSGPDAPMPEPNGMSGMTG